MGIVTREIPKEIVIELARVNMSTIFVETGTFSGETGRWASKYFEVVHTIELSENLYNSNSNELTQIKQVKTHLGDSRDILPKIVKNIGNQKAVYWLDAHWSGGETDGESDECPLLDELACLSNRTEDIILIDDARLFLCAPPLPHNPSQWPTISDIVAVLLKSDKKPFTQILDDVIFIIPNEAALKHHLVSYAQRRSKYFWKEFLKLQQGKSFSKRSLKSIFAKIRCRKTTG